MSQYVNSIAAIKLEAGLIRQRESRRCRRRGRLNGCLVVIVLFFWPIVVGAQIRIVPDWSEDEAIGAGYFDPLLGQARRDVFMAAASYLGGLFSSSFPGETIRVKTSFRSLPDDRLGTSVPLEYVDSDRFTSRNPAYRPRTAYPLALANHLSGTNLSPGWHLEVQFSTSPGIVWSYRTDETPSVRSAQESLYTTMIHEMAHGLGFVTAIDPETGAFGSNLVHPSAFDRGLVRGENQRIPLAEMTNPERRAALASQELYWNGPRATSANNGKLVKMYAPNPFESGSSVSHLDQATFRVQGLILLPLDSDVVRGALGLGPIERAMLFDLGFTPAPKLPSRILAITQLGRARTIYFTTEAGASYRLKFASVPPLALRSWDPLPMMVEGDGSTQAITDTTLDEFRFYVVETIP